jgi:hypothetical protein
VFVLAYIGANMLLLSIAQEDTPPADPFGEELHEKFARVQDWRETTMQWSSSDEENETYSAKPSKKQNKKSGKALQKVFNDKYNPSGPSN